MCIERGRWRTRLRYRYQLTCLEKFNTSLFVYCLKIFAVKIFAVKIFDVCGIFESNQNAI